MLEQVYAVYTEHDYEGQKLYGVFTTPAIADEYVRNRVLRFMGKTGYVCCARVTLDVTDDNEPEELFFYRYNNDEWERVTG